MRGETDPDYVYDARQTRHLTRNLIQLHTDLDNRVFSQHHYDIDLICEWHKRLFAGVRDNFAGKPRNSLFGPEHLEFGPYGSCHRDEVHGRLLEHCGIAGGLFDQLRKLANARKANFVSDTIKASCYIHADLIRIQAFMDGNKRVGRIVMDWVLLKYGLPLVALEVPKIEYSNALHSFYTAKDIQPLVDLVLRSYSKRFA